MADQFTIGDTVQLKSGGRLWTVTRGTTADSPLVQCTSDSGKRVEVREFPLEALKRGKVYEGFQEKRLSEGSEEP